MKPCGLALFYGAADLGHGAGADEGGLAGFARLAHLGSVMPTRPSGGSV